MSSFTEWKVGGAILGAGVFGLLIWFFWGESAAAREARLSAELEQERVAAQHAARSTALRQCQHAIKAASRDPETAVVPAIEAMSGGADHRFLWNQSSRMVRLKNGLGLEVPATAVCVVGEDGARIKMLTVDGVALVAPSGA